MWRIVADMRGAVDEEARRQSWTPIRVRGRVVGFARDPETAEALARRTGVWAERFGSEPEEVVGTLARYDQTLLPIEISDQNQPAVHEEA